MVQSHLLAKITLLILSSFLHFHKFSQSFQDVIGIIIFEITYATKMIHIPIFMSNVTLLLLSGRKVDLIFILISLYSIHFLGALMFGSFIFMYVYLRSSLQ